jgi:hypothetical protein
LNISSTEAIEEIRIIDLTGRIVWLEQIGKERYTLEGFTQSKGIYFLHCILASGNEVTCKIISR